MFSLSTFYRSREWELLVAQIRIKRLTKDGLLLCEHCGKPIIKPYDIIGHHVIELTEDNVNDYNISLNEDNIKLVHHRCHNQIHERFGYDGTRHVYIVYGAPCSGKREYVNEVAGKDDLILDLDSIHECISTNDRYVKSKRLSANVFGIRDIILDQIRTRYGRWRNAFIIGGYPLTNERERLANMLNAELIYIEGNIDECLTRAQSFRPEGYKKYITEWFERYELSKDTPPPLTEI